jgi:hypothetical protein
MNDRFLAFKNDIFFLKKKENSKCSIIRYTCYKNVDVNRYTYFGCKVRSTVWMWMEIKSPASVLAHARIPTKLVSVP